MKENIFYFHANTKENKEVRRFTVAIITNSTFTNLRVGVAVCNPKDQFIKKTGRAYAAGRALEQPFMIVTSAQTPSKRNVIDFGIGLLNNINENIKYYLGLINSTLPIYEDEDVISLEDYLKTYQSVDQESAITPAEKA